MVRYLIVGNGVAGTTAAEHIRKGDRTGKITIVTEEAVPFYWRIRLNGFIAGDLDEAALPVKKDSWYKNQAVDLQLGTRIQGADRGKRLLLTSNRREIPYDRLLLATGSRPFVPSIQGAGKPGVFTLRSIQDAKNILSWSQTVEHVVLIGGGLLGLEAGNALRQRGKNVTVIEFSPRILPRQLDPEASRRLQAMMEKMGLDFRLGKKTEGMLGEDRVQGVLLEGGQSLLAQMVIVSAGVRPDLDLAKSMEIEADKGIKVDERMMTNREDIFAAGDGAETKGIAYGIWPAAMEQGKIAGINMAGGNSLYHGTVMVNTLKVVGIDLASAGDIDPKGKLECRISKNDTVYKKIVFANDRLVGCIMLGDTQGFFAIAKMITDHQDVAKIKDRILP